MKTEKELKNEIFALYSALRAKNANEEQIAKSLVNHINDNCSPFDIDKLNEAFKLSIENKDTTLLVRKLMTEYDKEYLKELHNAIEYENVSGDIRKEIHKGKRINFIIALLTPIISYIIIFKFNLFNLGSAEWVNSGAFGIFVGVLLIIIITGLVNLMIKKGFDSIGLIISWFALGIGLYFIIDLILKSRDKATIFLYIYLGLTGIYGLYGVYVLFRDIIEYFIGVKNKKIEDMQSDVKKGNYMSLLLNKNKGLAEDEIKKIETDIKNSSNQ